MTGRFFRAPIGRRALFLMPLVTVLALSACAGSPIETVTSFSARNPAAPYIGRSEADIVACAGEPYSRYRTTKGENLIYRYSGAGPTPGNTGAQKGGGGNPFAKKSSDKSWDCSATLSFEGGRLTDVRFAPRNVQSRYDENGRVKDNLPSCQFSLPSCRAG